VTEPTKLSRVGFTVIKLQINGDDFFLMRKNLKWNDVSFIGGHEMPRDSGNLLRAARRELLEEVPALRSFGAVELVPLTDAVSHGPRFSPSANAHVRYIIQFFLVRFGSDPSDVVTSLGPRTPNLLLRQEELLTKRPFQVASLVDLLHQVVRGGLPAIPYSWESNLDLAGKGTSALDQRELSWH
jgi:hypothetical protein